MAVSAENGASSGLSSDMPEADAKQIAEMARRTFDKDGPLLVVASRRDTIPDFAALMCAASVWHAELAPLPKPLLVVNTGGP
ncbi:mitochondrial fission protein ELM1 [Pyrus ussuriensis x Pyrus communis]|uniref:Mitochondrial fission protein ELM1 n=1 Tax=Pyrus ussuriensis x Pyrus communis TaxID=2448454 RepID=A0A5N5HW41_9ROSA|nr:mitochondrial fission protein ELM1 [Pyrus ussuriensis x Pyrus communis]